MTSHCYNFALEYEAWPSATEDPVKAIRSLYSLTSTPSYSLNSDSKRPPPTNRCSFMHSRRPLIKHVAKQSAQQTESVTTVTPLRGIPLLPTSKRQKTQSRDPPPPISCYKLCNSGATQSSQQTVTVTTLRGMPLMPISEWPESH
jgi:hypothetical protein